VVMGRSRLNQFSNSKWGVRTYLLNFNEVVYINAKTLSGPFLVSRTGDVGCSKRLVEVSHFLWIGTTKGVGRRRQQDGGHGSRYPLRKV